MASILEHLIAAHKVTDFPLWSSKIHAKYKIQLFCLHYATTMLQPCCRYNKIFYSKMDQP